MYYIKGKQGNPTLMGSTVSSIVAFRNGETVRAGIRPVIHLTDSQYNEFAKIADADQTVLFGVFPQRISSQNDTLNDLWKQGSPRIRFVEDFYRNYGADYIFDDKHLVRKKISPYDNKINILSKTKDSKSLMKYYLNDILVKNNTNTFLYCVLAGSGMGKTTFAVNLLKQYINKYKEDTIPYDIYLFNLYYNTIKEIRDFIKNDIQKKSNDIKNPTKQRILILDALDENTEATENYKQFNDELEQFIKDYRFKAVIITCRTQFFDNEMEEPAETTIIGDDSSDGHKYLERYDKQYISVFNDKEIRKYIKEKFPCWLNFNNIRKRNKAKEIVEKCTSLMVRPLLLSYIDDLLDEKDADLSKITNIYKILIDKWLDREVQFWKTRDNSISSDELKSKLYSFSEGLAVEIYKNREHRVSVKEMDKFMVEKLFTDNYEYKGRSLVNRDALGNIKFAHKSFLEYFLAKQLFEVKIYLPSFEGMDMAKTFFQELRDIETDRLLKEGTITCYHSKRYGPCLIINKAIKHIIYPNNLFNYTTICISWENVKDSLFSLINTSYAKLVVIFNFKDNNQNIKILKNSIPTSVNGNNISIFILSDIISEELHDLCDISFLDIEVINKEEINRLTPEDIEQTLHYLSSVHEFKNTIEYILHALSNNKQNVSRKLKNVLENLISNIIIESCEVSLYKYIDRPIPGGRVLLDEYDFFVNKFKRSRHSNNSINVIKLNRYIDRIQGRSLLDEYDYFVNKSKRSRHPHPNRYYVQNYNEIYNYRNTFLYLLGQKDYLGFILCINCKRNYIFNETNIQNLLHFLDKSRDTLYYICSLLLVNK